MVLLTVLSRVVLTFDSSVIYDAYNETLAGQITRRVAPSTGSSIIIIILFFRMNIVH